MRETPILSGFLAHDFCLHTPIHTPREPVSNGDHRAGTEGRLVVPTFQTRVGSGGLEDPREETVQTDLTGRHRLSDAMRRDLRSSD